jgi:hypothetical protein
MPAEVRSESGGGNTAVADPPVVTRADPGDAANQASMQAATQTGMQAERTRQLEIRAAVQAARSTLGADSEALALRLIDGGVNIDEARREVLEALSQRSNATTTRGAAQVRSAGDEVMVVRNCMSDAIALRSRPGLATHGERTVDAAGARAYRGMDLIDLARRSIQLAGGSADGLSRREIALAALNLDSDAVRSAGMHSSSDFPNMLAVNVTRTLRQAYTYAPRTFTGWARRTTHKDFREQAIMALSELSKLQKVNEGGEYKFLTFGQTSEKYGLAKYGGIVAITWEALVNDDMGLFDRIPLMIAEEAAALESDVVYGILTANAPLADNVALFHATHKNLAGAAGPLNITTLAAARAALRTQTGPGGRVLNLEPSFLVVGPLQEVAAFQMTSAQFVATKNVDINPASNTMLTVVVDGRITDYAWYLMAAPGRIDTVEYAFLEGEEGLFTERKEGFEVDGLLIKARHVFAAKAIDFRGMWKNAGTA